MDQTGVEKLYSVQLIYFESIRYKHSCLLLHLALSQCDQIGHFLKWIKHAPKKFYSVQIFYKS